MHSNSNKQLPGRYRPYSYDWLGQLHSLSNSQPSQLQCTDQTDLGRKRLNLLVLMTKVYRILFFFRPFDVSMTNITRGHRVSTKIKESTEVAHFGANFALTEVHENL